MIQSNLDDSITGSLDHSVRSCFLRENFTDLIQSHILDHNVRVVLPSRKFYTGSFTVYVQRINCLEWSLTVSQIQYPDYDLDH